MAKTEAEEALTQLATRIPKDLHRQLKLHCVQSNTLLMDFVVEGLMEKMGRKRGRKNRTA
jgi:hypothetical protein